MRIFDHAHKAATEMIAGPKMKIKFLDESAGISYFVVDATQIKSTVQNAIAKPARKLPKLKPPSSISIFAFSFSIFLTHRPDLSFISFLRSLSFAIAESVSQQRPNSIRLTI